MSTYTCGSKNFIYGMYEVLREKIRGLKGSIFQRSNRAYGLTFCKNDTIRLRDFIYKYDNGLRLIRKYDLFQKTNKECSCDFWEYVKANNYVRRLNLTSAMQWKDYCKRGDKPSSLPNRPDAVYKGRGWNGWKDFLTREIY